MYAWMPCIVAIASLREGGAPKGRREPAGYYAMMRRKLYSYTTAEGCALNPVQV